MIDHRSCEIKAQCDQSTAPVSLLLHVCTSLVLGTRSLVLGTRLGLNCSSRVEWVSTLLFKREVLESKWRCFVNWRWKENMAGLEMDTTCATYEAISFEQDVFPKTKEPVWILGKQYITDRGKGNSIRQSEILKTCMTMPEFPNTADKILLSKHNSFFCQFICAITLLLPVIFMLLL